MQQAANTTLSAVLRRSSAADDRLLGRPRGPSINSSIPFAPTEKFGLEYAVGLPYTLMMGDPPEKKTVRYESIRYNCSLNEL